MLENEILFDDIAVLQTTLGKTHVIGSVKNDCDCSNYTETQDDEGAGSPQIA